MTFCWLPQILSHQLLRLHNCTPHYLFLINFITFIFNFGCPQYIYIYFFPPFYLCPFLMVEVEPLLSLSLSHGQHPLHLPPELTHSNHSSCSQTPNAQTMPKVPPFSSTMPTQMAQTRVGLGGDKFTTVNNFQEKLLKLKDLIKIKVKAMS